MREVEAVLGSAVLKEGGGQGGGPETVTEIGGFDEEGSQRAYLERSFPPGSLDTPKGKEITSQVGYWLCGWFIFSAV